MFQHKCLNQFIQTINRLYSASSPVQSPCNVRLRACLYKVGHWIQSDRVGFDCIFLCTFSLISLRYIHLASVMVTTPKQSWSLTSRPPPPARPTHLSISIFRQSSVECYICKRATHFVCENRSNHIVVPLTVFTIRASLYISASHFMSLCFSLLICIWKRTLTHHTSLRLQLHLQRSWHKSSRQTS